MKKVAIITISDNNNYGNRLQNYALQEVIKNNGYKVYTLWNECRKCDIYWRLKKAVKNILKIFIKRFRSLENKERVRSFERFTNKYINNYIWTVYTGNALNNLGDKFDKFVIGSDQIWNYEFRGIYFGNFEFARFAQKEKCISYSASMGMNEIPEDKKDIYADGIKHIDKLSVREEKGAEIIKELTNRQARVVLDPTMLLSSEQWEKVAKSPKKMPPQNYILTYFVGGITEDRKKQLERITKERNISVINLNIKDNEYYSCGPSEFIYLIKNSNLIFTDSFHACIFSILFKKNFYVLDRTDDYKGMNSRLETLLNRYNLSDRKIEKIEYKNEMINFDDIHIKIDEDKKENINFLMKALKE